MDDVSAPVARHRAGGPPDHRGSAGLPLVPVSGTPRRADEAGRSVSAPVARAGSRRLIPVVVAVLALVVVGWAVQRRSPPVAASAATLSAPALTAPAQPVLPGTAGAAAGSTAGSLLPAGRAVPSPTAGASSLAAAGDPTTGLGAPLVVAPVPPTAAAGRVATSSATSAGTSVAAAVATSVVAVTPLAAPGGPPSHRATPPRWDAVVGGLLHARSEAFAAGRPDLLVRADAEGSSVLGADRSLFAQAVTARGFDRVVGLTFVLDSVRPLATGAGRARLQVTGRQSACELVGSSGRRSVPAGPSRRLTVELARTGTGRWLLAGSWPS